MSSLFYYTGLVVWAFICFGIFCFLCACFLSLWDRTISPSLENLRFALFGKPWRENCTYYQLWSGMAKWHYRYYTRGNGNRHFARCAIKRLIMEARKESKRTRDR